MRTGTFDLQSITPLPIEQVMVADKSLPDVYITTPTGRKQIRLKKEHYPFIFGSVTQTDIHANEVVQQIRKITGDAYEHLMSEWLKDLTNK